MLLFAGCTNRTVRLVLKLVLMNSITSSNAIPLINRLNSVKNQKSHSDECYLYLWLWVKHEYNVQNSNAAKKISIWTQYKYIGLL